MLESLGLRTPELGRLDESRGWLRQALDLYRRIGDRVSVLIDLAALARIAVSTSELQRAGVVWGAVEAEEIRGPLGLWASKRAAFAEHVLAVEAQNDFEDGRRAGRRLALDDAVGFALAP